MGKSKTDKEIKKGLNVIAKSSLFVFVAVFLSKIFTYLYRIIIARSLGPEAYGLFTLAFMIFGWFVSISSLGIFEGLLRFISMHRTKGEGERINYLKNFSFKLLLVSSILSGIVLFSLSNIISINIFNEPNLVIFLKFFAIAIPLMIFSNAFLSIIRANEKVKTYAFAQNILNNGIRLITLLVLIYAGLKTNAIIFSFLAGIIILLAFSYYYSKYKIISIKSRKKLSVKDKINLRREFLNYSWPLLFFAIINELFFWIDTFSVGFFLDATQVGFYNAAVPIALLLYVAPELFLQMFFPLITREYSMKRTKVVKEITKQVGKWIFAINLPLLFLLLLFPNAFINILFGQEYLVSANSLRILVIGAFFFSFTRVSEQLLRTIGKSRTILANILIVASINLILNWILVPKYGIEGAAISTSFSFILLSLAILIEFKFFAKYLPLRRKMIRALFAAIISSGIVLFFRGLITYSLTGVFLLTILFFLTYILLIYFFRALDKNDIQVIKNILKI